MDNIESRQAEHYDRIARDYEAHYADPYSLAYRARFIAGPLTTGLELQGRQVLDACCGGGELAEFLLTTGASVTALDISQQEIQIVERKLPGVTAVARSIFDTGFPDNTFDVVAIVSGLHHVAPRTQDAIDEIYRVLRPGGWLVFAEPHRGSLFDLFRRVWYLFDPLFEENERSLDMQTLMKDNRDRFDFVSTTYGGNIAYLLVLNSMVFRFPLRLKRLAAPALMRIEGWIERIQGPRTSCMVRARWRKR